MIDVAGSIHRSYLFPADRATAFAYYGDFHHVVSNLPLISMVKSYGDERYRVVYRSTELGVYRVRIFCDVQVTLDRTAWALRVDPWREPRPVPLQSGMTLTQAQGTYASVSLFHDEGPHTRVEYRLTLRAGLPVPLALSLVAGGLLQGVASSITARRMQDIIDTFIVRSIKAFENGRHGA